MHLVWCEDGCLGIARCVPVSSIVEVVNLVSVIYVESEVSTHGA